MLFRNIIGAGGFNTPIGTTVQFVVSASDSSPTQQSSYTATYNTTNLPGCQNGDIAILAISDDLSETFTVSAGWTSIYADSAFDGTSAAALYYRVLTGSFPTTTITNNVGNTAMSTSVAVYRNATYNTTTTTGTNTKDPASVTTTADGAVVVVLHGQDDSGTGTLTTSSGYTEREETFAGNNSYSTTYIQDKLADITAGTTDPGAIGGTFAATNVMRVATISLDAV